MKKQDESSQLTEIVTRCIENKSTTTSKNTTTKRCWAQSFQNLPCKYFSKTNQITIGTETYVKCQYDN